MEQQFPTYLNITAEGAQINPQIFDNDEQAMAMFFSWRSNDTILQTRVIGSEVIKYYFNKANGEKEWHEEPAWMIRFGPLIGHIPLSESKISNSERMSRYYMRFLAAMPDRFNPGTGERPLLLFSRRRALEAMQKANLSKLNPGVTWTGVVTERFPRGYIIDVGGFHMWLPLSLVDYQVVQPKTLALGEMIEVKITENRNKKLMVVSRKDAQENPFDHHQEKYVQGSRAIGQVRVLQGLIGYAVLDDGISVRFRRGIERHILRTGTYVTLRLLRKITEEKVFEGIVEDIVSQPEIYA